MLYDLALVTGASSGLGKEIAIKLSKKKIPLLLTGRDQKRLEDTAKLCGAECIALDLTEAKGLKELIRIIKKKAPGLVINCAGFGLYGRVLEYKTKEQMDLLRINAEIPIEISIEAARALYAHKKKGTILNVSSVAGFYRFPTLSMYAASKGFLTQFSESFDYEMKPYGIRILVSCPGQIDTDFIYRAGGKRGHPRNLAMSTEYAASRILKQIEQKKGKVVFDFRYKLALFARVFGNILTRRLVREIEKRYDKRKYLTE